jgi:hypothetical protein
MPILGILASSLLKAIIDNFNRTTSGSLGTATSGQIWNAIRGVWFANGSAAQSNNTATDYAIAAISLGQNVTVNVDTTGGCGTSFWVTDSGSWWGAFPHYSSTSSSVCTGPTAFCYTAGCTPADSCGAISESTTTTCTGPTVSCTDSSDTCNPGGCGTVSSSSSVTCTGPTVSCTDSSNTCNPGGCGTVSSSSAVTCTGPTVSCTDTSDTCNPGGCGTVTSSGVTSYSCPDPAYPYLCPGQTCNELPDCNGASITATPGATTYTRTQKTNATTYTRTQNTNVATYTRTQNTTVTNYTRSSATNVTTTTYTSAIRIISSVSGSVVTDSTTTLATSASAYPNIASMQTNTNGTTLTVKGYSGAGQTTQLGSTITRTPTTPVRGTSVGTIKAPTTANQGSTLDSFSATS